MRKILIGLIFGFFAFSPIADASRFEDVNTKHQDSQDLDAFGRLRVSDPFNIIDMQFNYDLQPLFFEESATGNGDVVHIATESAARLTTGGTTDAHGVIFQLFQYCRYQPGKSQLIYFTAILGPLTTNVRKRIGYFDADNGLFFEQDGTNLKVVRRTKTSGAVVDNVFNQTDWNLDNLDGDNDAENPSGINLDETKDNIFIIDFQWLGGGRIRYGFDFDGRVTYVHQIKFANTESVPFMTTGNLPVRAEIFNTGAASAETTFDFTCVVVASEGGFNPLGIKHSSNTLSTAEAVTTIEPILSIRPKTTFNSITNRGQILPLEVDVLSTAEPLLVEVFFNPTLTGASFASSEANSAVESDVTASAITGGERVASFLVAAASQGSRLTPGVSAKSLLSKMTLNLDLAGTTADILTVAARSLTGSTTDVYVAITWLELR